MTEPSTYPESPLRLLACRLCMIASALLVYRVGDWVALLILLVSVAIFYLPRSAVKSAIAPSWMLQLWRVSCLVVMVCYFTINMETPAGSVVPPILAYGLVLLTAVQMVGDRVRQKGGAGEPVS